MSSSTFRILKQCAMCGNMFQAQKVSTLYCTHTCNQKHYKLKKKLEKKGIAESNTLTPAQSFRPAVKAIDLAQVKDKEFLTVKQVAILFGCNPKTVYSMISSGKIQAVNLGEKKTLIKRSNIDKLFI